MSIITPNDFKGEQSIGQVSNPGTFQSVQIFIDQYEPEFLKKLLGVTLSNLFLAGLESDPINERWVELRDQTDLKQMLVRYVYYWYTRDNVSFTAGTGEVKAKNENSNPISPALKQCKSWNDMVSMARLFDLSNVIYPEYVRPFFANYSRYNACIIDIYYPINMNNI